MAQAMAETINYVNRSRAFMPPGTVSPFVMRFDTGSVPVGYLVLSSETRTLGEIQDLALFRVRPMFASAAGRLGAAAVRRQPADDRHQRRPRPPARLPHVARRRDRGRGQRQHDQPLGQRAHRRQVSDRAAQLDGRPRRGAGQHSHAHRRRRRSIYLRDLATIQDSSDIPTGYALVNGRRAVYLLCTKRADASTLSVVNEVKAQPAEDAGRAARRHPRQLRVRPVALRDPGDSRAGASRGRWARC